VSLPTPTSDLGVLYPFVLKSNPIPMSNLVFHPDGDCSWQGIAGQVQDMQGRPVRGLSVHLTGSYNGRAVDMTTLSGAAQAWYGESGFEFVLGTTPLDSRMNCIYSWLIKAWWHFRQQCRSRHSQHAIKTWYW